MGRLKGSKNIDSKLEGVVLLIKALHPDWSAERVRREVRQYLACPANGNLFIPKLRTIQKMLENGRSKLGKVADSGLDTPWALSKTPDLPSEAIAAIFAVQGWLETVKDKPNIATSGIKEWTEYYTDNEMPTEVWPITVREALWISKLYKVGYPLSSPEILFLKIHKHPVVAYRALIENPYCLWKVAKTYADYQRLCDLVDDTDFETSRLDEALRNGNIGKTKYELFFEYKSKKEGEK